MSTNKPTFLDPYTNLPREQCLKVSLLISKEDISFIRGISPHESVFRIFANILINKAVNELKQIGITTYDERFESAIAGATIRFDLPTNIIDTDGRHIATVKSGYDHAANLIGLDGRLDGRTHPLARPASSQGHDGRATPSLRPQEPDAPSVSADVKRTTRPERKGQGKKRK